MWTIDRCRADLVSIAASFATSKGINDAARSMLVVEQQGISRRLDRAAGKLRKAEEEVDPNGFRAVVEELPSVMENITALRRTVIIVEAAATAKRP